MAADDGSGTNPPLHGGVRLEAVRLSTTVDGGRVSLLREISLVIQPREFVAIVGASGTGKTTLLDALSGLRPATSGTVRINGGRLVPVPPRLHRSVWLRAAGGHHPP